MTDLNEAKKAIDKKLDQSFEQAATFPFTTISPEPLTSLVNNNVSEEKDPANICLLLQDKPETFNPYDNCQGTTHHQSRGTRRMTFNTGSPLVTMQ